MQPQSEVAVQGHCSHWHPVLPLSAKAKEVANTKHMIKYCIRVLLVVLKFGAFASKSQILKETAGTLAIGH